MSDLLPELDRYLQAIIPPRPRTLVEMESYAELNDFPIIGPVAGRLLFQQALHYASSSNSTKVKIFELGSGYGYSAYWFSMALGRLAEIHLTDNNEANLAMAQEHFRQGRLKSKFVYHLGDAISSFNNTRGKFDIVLNDIDKVDYPAVVKAIIPRLKKGGILISDNLIWSGKVFGKNRDKATQALRNYTKLVYSHPKLFTTLIPIRDGVAISVKL